MSIAALSGVWGTDLQRWETKLFFFCFVCRCCCCSLSEASLLIYCSCSLRVAFYCHAPVYVSYVFASLQAG
ncbi:hypothetical protein TRSC58_07214 [Trypanosoma rangeli SC58]|uniref:Uncharacterized protein n=1 Tax=Trypanosoma rangeli SC58 TaxID=429131 RepID=A0A061ITP6_TRYRA|nr:hypothetical protein TRSC58_07214 [Trypanosoma rangeli SC58]